MEENAEDESELYEKATIQVDKNQSLLRIDKFLTDRLKNITRNRIQLALDNGYITVNGVSTKPNYKIKPGDLIAVFIPSPPRHDELLPEEIPLDIVYEDASLLILNKPPGLVVHPGQGNWSGTLVNGLLYHFDHLPTHKNGEIRPGLVHRIDKDTSGLMVIAKTESAMSILAKQFFDHSIERTYQAIVWGSLKEQSGTIATHIGRSKQDRKIQAVVGDDEDGKLAITHFRVLADLEELSLVECKLETGRTHQIRVHMRHIGHPIFNDTTYGGDKILKGPNSGSYKAFIRECFTLLPRQALHAKTLGFNHPKTQEKVLWESNLYPDMQKMLHFWEENRKLIR